MYLTLTVPVCFNLNVRRVTSNPLINSNVFLIINLPDGRQATNNQQPTTKFMKSIIKNQLPTVLAICVVLLATFSGCKKDDDEEVDKMKRVTVTLSGAQETPAINSTGTGSAKLVFDPLLKTINYTITWTLGSSTATTTNMHFHGAEDGSDLKSSGVALGITGFTTANTGTLSGTTVPLTDIQVAQLLAGKWYLNIHSSTVPSGELRGNIKFQ
jgi:hypothetical protein